MGKVNEAIQVILGVFENGSDIVNQRGADKEINGYLLGNF